MQKKDAKRHKIKGGQQRKKKKIPKKKDILFKKGTKGKKRGQSYIYLFCINKFGPRMPETLRDALNSISMAMDVHIYTYFVKSS